MKHCPACNSTFPDFHRVCDFDGTVLVPGPARRSIFGPSRAPLVRRVLKSPKFLTTVAVLALFAVSTVIGYLAWPTQSIPMVRTQPASDFAREQRVARVVQTNVQTKKSGNTTGDAIASSRLARRAAVLRTQADARARRGNLARSNAAESHVARRKNDQSKDNDSDPKLVAVLKTTWRVLKKPFRF